MTSTSSDDLVPQCEEAPSRCSLDFGQPPSCCQDPLQLLQRYLANIAKDAAAIVGPMVVHQRERDNLLQKRHDEVLRADEFLFGGSILEGALAILDTGSGPTSSLVTRVVSVTSQRSLYVIRGSLSNSGRRDSLNSNPNTDYYLCLLPDENELVTACDGAANPVYYCSCRSFLERSRSPTTCVCNHLLALTLMSSLGVKETVTETVTDEEFCNFILSRIEV